MRPDCGTVDPISDNVDNNIREPFINTLISNIQPRFEDADIIDQLAILDLTGTDLVECMYGYTNMEALATYFDMDSESLLIQWQEFIQIVSSSDNRSLTHLNELFQSVDHKDKNLSSIYPLVSKLYSIAVIQPLSTAEVERIFSQVALIKTSQRTNIKTETLSKMFNIKYNCDQTLFNSIIDSVYMPLLSTKTEDL